VLPEIDYPDYLPENARTWAHEHRDLLEFIVDEFLRTGTWQPLKELTRKLAREGRPAALRSIFWEMPKPLGFINHNPERVILTPFGLRTTHAGHKLLAGFTAILTLAAERYLSDESDPVITRADAARGTLDPDPYVTALSDVVLLGAPFLGSGTGGPEEDWTREITDDVVRYLNSQSTEAYLRTRARELAGSPQLGWPPMAALRETPAATQHGPQSHAQASIEPVTISNESEAQRDVFISHASEDKDVIARPIAEELLRRGHSIWFDEFELTLGDSLRRSIDRGLAESRFGLVILSPSFFAKKWPQRELDGLTTREIEGPTKVILPVWHEVDHAYVAKFSPTLADKLAAQSTVGLPVIVHEIERALAKANTIGNPTEASVSIAAPVKPKGGQARVFRLKIPSTREEQVKVIAERPEFWEYLLFAGVLVKGKQELETKWDDHELRLPRGQRREFDLASANDFLDREIGWIRKCIVLDRILSPSIYRQAFGAPGEAGDPTKIEGMARRLLLMYESWLDWAAGLRNTSVPPVYEEVLETTACLIDGPILSVRAFIDHVAHQTAQLPELAADGTHEHPITLTFELKLDIEDEVVERNSRAWEKLRSELA
jgi:hypothetical protein